jgi:ferredoxin-NADP reductase
MRIPISNACPPDFVEAVVEELLQAGVDLQAVTLENFKARLSASIERQAWRLTAGGKSRIAGSPSATDRIKTEKRL